MGTSPIPQPSAHLAVQVSSANRRTTLRCTGRLVSSTVAEFASEAKRWTECSSVVVVDVGGLTYLDSAGLGALVSAYTSARKADCEFELHNVTSRVMHLLQLTNLIRVLRPTTENLL